MKFQFDKIMEITIGELLYYNCVQDYVYTFPYFIVNNKLQ
jgi:hypothetical protein